MMLERLIALASKPSDLRSLVARCRLGRKGGLWHIVVFGRRVLVLAPLTLARFFIDHPLVSGGGILTAQMSVSEKGRLSSALEGHDTQQRRARDV